MDSSENQSLFSSLIYRAIGEPEHWQQSSLEPILKLLSSEMSLDASDSMEQIEVGKDLVDRLTEKETLVTAVMSVLDGARYGLLIIDQEYKRIYHNDKLQDHIDKFLSPSEQQLLPSIVDAIRKHNWQIPGIKRLECTIAGIGNLYVRSVPQGGARGSQPNVLHYLMVADPSHAQEAVSKEVADAYDLSSREVSVVEAAVAPDSTTNMQDIADALFISRNTLKSHLKSIYAKTGANSIASLVSIFLQHEVQQLSSYFGAGDEGLDPSTSQGDQFVELGDEQILCYREYGDPKGKPLLVLHNNYSSRLNIPPNGDVLASRAGRYILIPDRPGYGKSPMCPRYPQNWCKTLAEFIERKSLPSIDLLANSLSVRHALEFAQAFPDRVNRLIFTSPLLLRTQDSKKYFGESIKVATMLFERSEKIAVEIYRLWHASMASQLDKHIEKTLSTTISSADKSHAQNPEFIRTLKANFAESAAQHSRGSAADIAYSFRHLKSDLSTISCPVDIWIGTEDGMISLQGVEEIFSDLPNLNIIVKEGHGEHIYYSLFAEVIAT